MAVAGAIARFDNDALPFGQSAAPTRGRSAVHDAVDDRVFSLVLQSKINVAARSAVKAADLAAHANVLSGSLDELLQHPIERRNAEHLALFPRARPGAERDLELRGGDTLDHGLYA